MPPTITRRELLAGTGALALLARAPMGFALGPSPSTGPAFIDGLVARMSVEEKAGQLTLLASAAQDSTAAGANPNATTRPTAERQVAAARAGRLTGVFNGSDPRWHQRLQKAALESRLKIPMIFAADVIHGFSTVFPVPLGETASFEPELARRTARAAALEATAVGIDWTFAPMVDIARDARWGRMVEGSGEDLLVGRRFADARVRGFQGDGLDRADAMLACPKHFAAYGAAEAGLDYNTVDVSERTLREVYFPPFQAGFDAGALSTMAAFNELSGIPATANTWLLDDVLRGEWGFRGLVVSDYTGDMELVAHGFAADAREATRLAFMAGVDMSMQSGLYMQYLPGLVADGAVPMARLDEAVRRVLQVKAALGLFDDPFRRHAPARAQSRQQRPETLALAREAARRSIVLLKNEGELLPLKRSNQRIALIGPFAEDWKNPTGPWSIFGSSGPGSDLASAMRKAMADPDALRVAKGCGVEAAIPGGIEAAVAAATAADVAVLAIGESRDASGEAQSRTEVVVPPAQQALVAAVVATGTPVVVVLSNGRALALDDAVLASPAILVGWFLGSASGTALADVLFGDYSPSGRLPVSFPRASGQVPYHYDHKPTGRPGSAPGALEKYKAHFHGTPNTARFAFGHGLTYGRIEYAALDTGPGTLAADGTLEITAQIRNRGNRAAEEVVQLYIRDRAASITRPVRELKDFRKIGLAPGATASVRFTLRRDDLLFIGQDLKPTVEPGQFDLWVAPSAEADGLAGSFELLA
jgi:beta-glucosidase